MPRRVAVAAPGVQAAEAGVGIVAEGGNAVDAAIAALCVATVTEPGIVNPMGGAFINVWAPGQEPVVVDGNDEMPGRGLPVDRFGRGVREFEMDYYGLFVVVGGHGSVATPGMFAAAAEASRRWGGAPWAELVTPAARVAREGYPLGQAASFYLQRSGPTLFSFDSQTRAFIEQSGKGVPLSAGTVLRSPDLGDSLEVIAREGAQALYTGELAHLIAADMAAHGGLLGLADLAAYRPVVRPALRSRLGGWDVAVNPAPSIGGPVLTTMLRLLADHHARAGHTDAGDIVDVQRLVLGYRRTAIDWADDLELAGREMIRLLEELGPAGMSLACSSPETVHISSVDDDGLACSITTSAGYGSGVTTPGTGLMHNNSLGEPELNRRGLHALPPGTRLASNMAPTTARRDDGTVLAVGSPGADRITTALLQVLAGVCLDDHDLRYAIERPRLHVAFAGDGSPRVDFEAGEGVTDRVLASGLPWVRHDRLEMYFGGVGAAQRHADGSLRAVGDPRRESAQVVG